MTIQTAIIKGMYLDVCYRFLVNIRLGLSSEDHDFLQRELIKNINHRGYKAVQHSLVWNSYRVLTCIDELRRGKNWVQNVCELSLILMGKYDKPSRF